MKSKKVLYLITKSNWGGAQRYVYDLATSLNREQFEPVVALGGDGTLKELLIHAGIRVISINSLERDISLKKEIGFSKELWSIIRAEKPDILHVNSSKAGGVGALLGRIARVPKVLFTAHGWTFNEDRPIWQKIIIKFFHYVTVLFSHQTIAVSNAIVKQMNWPLVRTKMKIINPGRTIGVMYEACEARTKIADFCPRLTPYLDTPWVLTIAELHPIKRINVLIESMKELSQDHPQVRSVIIGDGQLRVDLENQIKNLELEEHVFLIGSIPEAARFLQAGDVFVLPSKSESYGYVLHEAGLAKVPVIATDVGGIPDIICDSETGKLIPPDNKAALAKQLTDYFSHPAVWKAYAEAAYEKLSKRTVQKMTDATTALYTLPLK